MDVLNIGKQKLHSKEVGCPRETGQCREFLFVKMQTTYRVLWSPELFPKEKRY